MIPLSMKNPLLKSRGFTIIETLVAISILLLSIGGPIFAVSSAVSSAVYARDQITAFYLAQDAVEYVRGMRDDNALAQGDWADFLAELPASCTGSGSGQCAIDTTGIGSPFSTCSGACLPLGYAASTGLYQYSSGVASIFTRSVKFADPNPGDLNHEIRVQVTVSWQPSVTAEPKTFTITDNLLDWQH